MSDDQQVGFDEFDTLHPLARNTPVVSGGNIILNDAAYASGNVQPTTEAYFATPGTTWEDYLFQVARREKGFYYAGDLSGHLWRHSEYERFGPHGEQLGRDWLPFSHSINFDAPFADTDSMVQYIYNSPQRHQDYATGEAVYNYEMSEYDHYNEEFQDRLDHLILRLPRTDGVIGDGLRGAFNQLTNEWGKAILLKTNTRNPDVYRLVLRTNLENLEIMEEALNYGATGEDITNMLNSLQEEPTPMTLELNPEQFGEFVGADEQKFNEAGPDTWDNWDDLTAAERAELEETTVRNEATLQEYFDEIHTTNADDITMDDFAEFDQAIWEAADNRVLEPLGPEDVAGQELADYAEQLQQYHMNVLKQDYFYQIQANPNVTFEEATRIVSPGERRFAQNWRDVFNEANESFQGGEDLSLQLLNHPAPPAGLGNAPMAEVVEVEGEGGGLAVGPLNVTRPVPQLNTDPDWAPDAGAAVEDAEHFANPWAENSQFRIIDSAELRDAVLQAGVENGDFTILEAANLATEEMLDAIASAGLELIMGAAALAPFGVGGAPPDTSHRFQNEANVQQYFENEGDVQQLAQSVQGQQAYINIEGQWYLGEVSNAVVLNSMGYSQFPVASVKIHYESGGRYGGTQTYTVPIQNNSFRLADNFQPDMVARWQPYTDPTTEYPTSGMRAIDHLGDQILYDGQWRTLAMVRAYDPRGNPITGEVNPDTTLIWADGTEDLLPSKYTPLTYRVWGEGADLPTTLERVPQNVVQRAETQRTPVVATPPTTPVGPQRAETTFERREQQPTSEPGWGGQVMSYLNREHNEVYTTWRAPNYTGTDPNRVERIFGGVVPFMSYNSEGHPILVNDQELDHHGHTEFNMVHIAPMEMEELAQGQVNVENEATVNQTNQNEPTGEGNSPTVPP